MNAYVLITVVLALLITGGIAAGRFLPEFAVHLFTAASLMTAVYAYVGFMRANLQGQYSARELYLVFVALPIGIFLAAMWFSAIWLRHVPHK